MMPLKKAAQQALEALEVSTRFVYADLRPQCEEAITALRAALADTQDWDEIEALRASLREHMAEIHRLRAAGRQALEALEEYQQKGAPFMSCDAAVNVLRAALEPVTDCHEKEGDNLSLPLESKDLSEESLNEVVAQLKAAGRESRINFTPTHMVLTGDTLDCLKKLADERDVPETNFGNMVQAVDFKEADHIPDATKMMVSVREDRTVEQVGYGVFEDGNLHDSFRLEHEANLFAALKGEHAEVRALYTAPPKREPLTEKQIESAVCAAYVEKALTRYDITIARAIERAHGIGGEE